MNQDYFKNYEWGSLWEKLHPLPKQCTQTDYLLKIALLASWWEAYDTALNNIARISLEKILGDFDVFLCAYIFLALGKVKEYEQYHKIVKGKNIIWMDEWLTVEYLGRSEQYEKQFLYIANKHPISIPPYIFAALLQSLHHEKARLTYIKKLNPMKLEGSKLGRVLKMRLYGRDYPKYDHLMQYHYGYRIKYIKEDFAAVYADLKILQSQNLLDKDSMLLLMELALGSDFKNSKLILQDLINKMPNSRNLRGIISAYGLINSYIRGDQGDLLNFLKIGMDFRGSIVPINLKPYEAYINWITKLLQFKKNDSSTNQREELQEKIYVIGESHTLSFANEKLAILDKKYGTDIRIVVGLKMHHVSSGEKSHRKFLFEKNLIIIPDRSIVVLAVGEIDCRPNEGIWRNSYDKNIDYKSVVERTVNNFIYYINQSPAIRSKSHKYILQGVPAPKYIRGELTDEIKSFLSMIKYFNYYLHSLCKKYKYGFIDVYNATANNNGLSNELWHLDNHHLSPAIYRNKNILKNYG